MAAQVKYQGTTAWVNYTLNSTALNGNDQIRILEGNLGSIYAFNGNDTVYGSSGADDINGGVGNDYLTGEAGNDRLYGESGADSIYGGDGNDSIVGGDGADQLFGQGGMDTIYGGIGNDTLNGGQGGDRLYGDGGNDLFIFENLTTGWDLAYDNSGDDRYRFDGSAKAEIFDATGNDLLIFSNVNFSSLDAIQVGDDIWVSSAQNIANAVASGMTLSANSISNGAWIHDGMTTGRIETVQGFDMTGSIDLLLM